MGRLWLSERAEGLRESVQTVPPPAAVRLNTELTCFGTATRLSGLNRIRMSDQANARYSVRQTKRRAVYFVGWLIRNQYEILQSSPADRRLARPGPRAHSPFPAVRQSTAGTAAALPACLPAGRPHPGQQRQSDARTNTPLCFLSRGSPHAR